MESVYNGCDIKNLNLLKEGKSSEVVGSNEYGIWTGNSFMMYAALYPRIMIGVNLTDEMRVKEEDGEEVEVDDKKYLVHREWEDDKT